MLYGDVEVLVSGRAYVLRYGNVAWDSLKQRFGVPTEVECVARARNGPGERLAYLRAGLAWHHPELSVADVLDLAQDEALGNAAWDAVILSLPEPNKKPKKKGPPKHEPIEPPGPHDLRREAFKAGMTPTEFGIVTPREAVMFIEAAAWRNTEASRLSLSNAWHSGNFSGAAFGGKLRDLSEVMRRAFHDESGPQSSAASRVAGARAMAARHNERVKKAREIGSN